MIDAPAASAMSISRAKPGSVLEHPRCLGEVSGDGIHESRRKAVVRFEMEFLQPSPNGPDLIGRSARLDDRGDERGELRGRPAMSFESSVWIKSNP